MNMDFAAAMRRATDATRALDVAEATRLIRQALGTLPDAPATTPHRPAPRRAPLCDLLAEDAVTVEPDGSPPRRRRRPLGEVVRGLREGRLKTGLLRTPAPRPVPAPPVPDGAAFEARSYAGAAGGRDYRLYVPASAGAGIRGLVVMLHGCTQSPEDFAVGTGMNALAEAHGLLVAYPAQTAAHNGNGCWNWFRPGDQRRGAGEPAILAGLVQALAAEFSVPRDRIFVAGLSAGGAMAAVMGETYPELFAAVGVHSGLPCGSASDVLSAFAAMRGTPQGAPPAAPPGARPRTIIFHGAADTIVHPSNATQLATRAGDGPLRAQGGARRISRSVARRADGTPGVELWLIDGLGHAWSGGNPAGSYTDPAGPDAAAEMVRFFLETPP
jgi:poly(hydroxyalkanoate) depolymerase family esterase